MSSKANNLQNLTETDVFDLVIEFLSTKGFVETTQVLKKEVQKSPSASSRKPGTRLEDLLEKSYVTELASGELVPRKRARSHLDAILLPKEKTDDASVEAEEEGSKKISIDTQIVSYNPCGNDPYGASVMPIYQTSTFMQPSATDFGSYDYSRSGNPTRDALQNQLAELDGGARAFCFSSGMSAIAAVSHLVQAGEEIILNDDSYGGTYRLVSKVATRQGVRVRYINMAGKAGPSNLLNAINSSTKLVMIESPTNPMQRICNIRELSRICHANDHKTGTLLSIDNTMLSPVLSRPIEHGADLVIHSATKFMCGHSDTMAGVVVVKDRAEGEKSLAEALYFYQNAEGTALSPFDCFLVSRGIKTMSLRVTRQMENALRVATWLKSLPIITKVIHAGLEDHPDYDIHSNQSSGGGSVVCFLTGDVLLSQHIVTTTKLFKITVSFGSVNSLISTPCSMSHASIPAEVRAARSFPEDLVRMSIGIESADDLISDLKKAITSYKKPIPSTVSG